MASPRPIRAENLSASIVIATKNRKEELKRAINSCMKLNGNPGILIFDDGSDDGTFAYIKETFPGINIYREEKSIGLIDARTKAATLVEEDIIFSIDDDAIFTDENTVVEILKYFDHPSVGAVTIPYIDIYKSQQVKQIGHSDFNKLLACGVFRGTAHALRRNIFLKLGGYEKNFVRQGEESDYAIRMYVNGYFIRVGNSKPIIHFESPTRDTKFIDYYAARNSLIIAYKYTPGVILIPYLFWLCIQLYINSVNKRTTSSINKGIKDGIKAIHESIFIRTPMPFFKFIAYKLLLHRNKEIR